MGDVIVDQDDLFGEGVNIAARIEPLAPPGGIAISEKAYAEVRRHINFTFDDTGAHALKNIQELVKVWAWRPDASATAAPVSKETKTKVSDGLAVVGVLPFEIKVPTRRTNIFPTE